MHRKALIAGEDGILESTFANHTTDTPPILTLRRGRDRRDDVETITVPAINGFLAEADAFADFVDSGEWNGIPEQESLDVADMLDRLRQLVRTQQWSS